MFVYFFVSNINIWAQDEIMFISCSYEGDALL